MDSLLQIAGHIAITVIAVVGLALRLEHRLTKIETDVTWLKRNAKAFCQGEFDNDTHNKMDST